jgi:oligoribonuclease (3'-5' exoribonuclease)
MKHLIVSFHVDEVEQINMTELANRWKSQVNQAVAKSKHHL